VSLIAGAEHERAVEVNPSSREVPLALQQNGTQPMTLRVKGIEFNRSLKVPGASSGEA